MRNRQRARNTNHPQPSPSSAAAAVQRAAKTRNLQTCLPPQLRQQPLPAPRQLQLGSRKRDAADHPSQRAKSRNQSVRAGDHRRILNLRRTMRTKMGRGKRRNQRRNVANLHQHRTNSCCLCSIYASSAAIPFFLRTTNTSSSR